ncbi:MAG: hypothetical protein RL377_1306 [Bacteroidota bacterium]
MSILKLLHVPVEVINSHVGWTHDSKMLKVYFRNVLVTKEDREFFSAVFF